MQLFSHSILLFARSVAEKMLGKEGGKINLCSYMCLWCLMFCFVTNAATSVDMKLRWRSLLKKTTLHIRPGLPTKNMRFPQAEVCNQNLKLEIRGLTEGKFQGVL